MKSVSDIARIARDVVAILLILYTGFGLFASKESTALAFSALNKRLDNLEASVTQIQGTLMRRPP